MSISRVEVDFKVTEGIAQGQGQVRDYLEVLIRLLYCLQFNIISLRL